VVFRPGVLPNDPSKPRLKLKHFLTAAPSIPPTEDWDKAVAGDWPMYGNDKYGDCVFAMLGHAIETWTANAGRLVKVTDADVLKGYSDVTGFNPSDPSTDNGTVMQDAFDYWRRIGLAGHKILAFAQVDHTNPAEMEAAVALFGEVLLAIDFPAVAMDQFNAGKPWDVVRNDGGIEGGHAICSAKYDAAKKQWTVITWAKEQPVTFAFLAKYLSEAWVAISPEWIATNGKTPSGLDLAGLGAAFAELTGEPNPFPDNPPQPPQPPLPPQPPVSTLAQIVDAMATDHSVAVWVHNHHFGHAAVLQHFLKELLAAPRS
jgi:hypothetical protein